MEEKDTIIITNENGVEEEAELVLTVDGNNKRYILYRNKDNELFASYLIKDDDEFHNDLTDEEYDMLEKMYKKGLEIYDK